MHLCEVLRSIQDLKSASLHATSYFIWTLCVAKSRETMEEWQHKYTTPLSHLRCVGWAKSMYIESLYAIIAALFSGFLLFCYPCICSTAEETVEEVVKLAANQHNTVTEVTLKQCQESPNRTTLCEIATAHVAADSLCGRITYISTLNEESQRLHKVLVHHTGGGKVPAMSGQSLNKHCKYNSWV